MGRSIESETGSSKLTPIAGYGRLEPWQNTIINHFCTGTGIKDSYSKVPNKYVTDGVTTEALENFITSASQFQKHHLFEIYPWDGKTELPQASDSKFPYKISGKTYIIEELQLVNGNSDNKTIQVIPPGGMIYPLTDHLQEWTSAGSLFILLPKQKEKKNPKGVNLFHPSGA